MLVVFVMTIHVRADVDGNEVGNKMDWPVGSSGRSCVV